MKRTPCLSASHGGTLVRCAAMLLAADILVRVVLPTKDLKLGVVTALVGAPLFLHLIYKTRRQMA